MGLDYREIGNAEYVFLSHAKKRQKDRNINDLTVLNILENKADYKRQRNKAKYIYTPGKTDWNYCIEGIDLDDDNKVRVILSFNEFNLLIITVIRLDYGV